MRRMLQWIPAILGLALVAVAPIQSRAWTPQALVSFCALANCADGAGPKAGLIADANGNLFGTTLYGGADTGPNGLGGGTVFEIAKTAGGYASTPTILYSFCALANCADGSNPQASLRADANGNLFGTTSQGGLHASNNGGSAYGGTVFEIAKTADGYASTPTTLYSFCALANCADGSNPQASLLADANGNLFGTTAGGGGYSGLEDSQGGTVFKIGKIAGGYASTPNVVSFCAMPGHCPGGEIPEAGLIADANGNLFGTAIEGGAYDEFSGGAGTVFESPNSGFVSDAPFASLSAVLRITGGQHPAFTLDARFRLAAGGNGIKPPSEPVRLQVGPYAALIPAGSFRQLPAGTYSSVYGFSGEIGNVSLSVDIDSLGGNSYRFVAAGTPPDPRGNGMLASVPVSLRIGYVAGSTVATVVRLP
jgi:hypothetical protein